VSQSIPLQQRRPRIHWRQVWTVYVRELRSAFRERAIVLNSILIPIFLYPLILWAAFSGIMFVQGQSDRVTSRVRVEGWPQDHHRLRTQFERDPTLSMVERAMPASAAERAIREGTVDVYVQFLPDDVDETGMPGNFQARLLYHGGQDRSVAARDRVREKVERYREEWVKREAGRLAIDASTWERFTIEMRNLASGRQMGGFVLGMVLPLLFVVMVAVGCFYPAVDCIAGERERNTWETLMSTAAGRGSIMAAKYLYVTTLGGLAGALNLATLALTLKPIFGPLLSRAGVPMNFTVPLSAIPVLILAAVLFSGFVASGMMVFASFARTFKEGQAMIMPFYMLILLPAVFVQMPGLKFTPGLAMFPVVNVTLMVRSAVAGAFPWVAILLTILVSLGLIALSLSATTFVLKFEDVLMGSYSGNLRRFVRERVLRRAGRPAAPVDSSPHP
jgi:sodium transport system permease protein